MIDRYTILDSWTLTSRINNEWRREKGEGEKPIPHHSWHGPKQKTEREADSQETQMQTQTEESFESLDAADGSTDPIPGPWRRF